MDDVLGGMAVLELVRRRVFDEVNSGLLGIAVQRSIEDELKVGGGRG